MHTNWVWIAVAVFGQVVCVATVMSWARSHPSERYPLGWVNGRILTTRLWLTLGAGATLLGATLGQDGTETPALRLAIVLVAFVPTVVAIVVVNARSVRHRRSAAINTRTDVSSISWGG
ncbi:hypothetical protein ACFXP7_04375 [Microbacterium sp. P06]|uniref:hypothetical protein n=1 Tax=Microbacterium sp. P06 TaxID=3366949 RepID=UPI003745B17D